MSRLFGKVKTKLDLNGPTLSFTTNPVSVASTGVGIGSTNGPSVTLTGIATAGFAHTAVNKGAIAYQWYENTLGKLSDGEKYNGTNTTTLTVSNIITPTDDGTEYFLEADYVPGQPDARTGNALNEPLNSGIATVTVIPIIDIISQPSSVATIQNIDATFTISAQLTNGSTGGISYQWQIDEQDITDGDISYNTSSSTRYRQELVDGGSFFIPADATDVKLDLAAGPGGDGDIGSPPDDFGTGGVGGGGKTAWFTIPNAGGKTVQFFKGYKGSDGIVGGAGGSGAAFGGTGNPGNPGNPGAGGGGGGATSIRIDGTLAIVLGGGGGGGAAGHVSQISSNGQNGVDANTAFVQNTNGNIPLSAGGNGEGNTGSGGGGGGSGITGANGGAGGFPIGLGGQGGVNTFDPNLVSFNGSSLNPAFANSDGWGEINYTSASASPPTSQNLVVSGTQTPTLTIRSDSILTRRIRCVVSHASEDISDVISNEVNFICQSSTDTSNLNIETIGTTSTATLSTHDLADGEYTFEMVPSSPTSTVLYYCLYSPDKDIDIEMDLFGGKGNDYNQPDTGVLAHSGGQGGYSRIRFTLERNTEYIISGLNDIINTPFVYRKASLMACVGQGGDAGPNGAGGAGGGTNISGNLGQGFGSGAGGVTPGLGESLSTNGVYGSGFTTTDTTSLYYVPPTYVGDTQATGRNGGRTITCPKGVFWSVQGISFCSDVINVLNQGESLTKFIQSDGTEVTNTAAITRGYKAGYDIIQTAGVGGNGYRGGNGATGGSGPTNNNPNAIAGSGGGSGFQDGSVTVVDQQRGGSNGSSKVVVRLAV